ncbi:MAG: SDR family NAD(P)-dependent oxidoreductase [Bacteroidetes bacterium]|nr:SDR family NAD(P)-dependent oxidoreductase [Bacteroidota bacterium]
MPNPIFRNKVVLLTGAGSGIGRALAAELCAAGARLYASDRDAAALEQAAATWNGSPSPDLETLDVTDSLALRSWIQRCAQREGRLDYLFNNAGMGMAGEFRHMTAQDWEQVLAVNLSAVVHGCHEAFPIMARHGGGHLVNTASLLGISPSPLASLYSATKHGVIGLSNTLAMEGAALGIRVTAICPGYIDTAIFNNAPKRGTSKQAMLALLPWRLLPADQAARAILKGVAANKRLVVFPDHARLSAWLWKHLPGLYAALNKRLLEQHRREALS